MDGCREGGCKKARVKPPGVLERVSQTAAPRRASLVRLLVRTPDIYPTGARSCGGGGIALNSQPRRIGVPLAQFLENKMSAPAVVARSASQHASPRYREGGLPTVDEDRKASFVRYESAGVGDASSPLAIRLYG